jgi:lipid-A-disaccharide synthase-like uncharacterized protein
MCELMLIYTVFALAATTAPTGDALIFFSMPFHENTLLWKIIGFSGIGIFGTRFIIQWLHSEKHQESRIPNIFWWQSLLGTLFCLLYFLRQKDTVGVAGYLFNIIPYTRNLMLIYGKKNHHPTAHQPSTPTSSSTT